MLTEIQKQQVREQIGALRAAASAVICMGRPHSRCVSPGHLLVASMPILLPRPETGDRKAHV